MDCPIINLTKELVSIPSISPFDLGCQTIISNRLKSIGFKIVCLNYNNTNNLWAYRGKGTTLCFAGHTDVVSPGNEKYWNSSPFLPIIKNGYLFGRGTSDMKGSLAAMVIAAEKFISFFPNHKGRLSFLITSDEESSAEDGMVKIVNYLKSIKENIDYCIIGEPSSNKIIADTIKVGRRGSLNADLLIYGVQGHIAYPELAINPIHNSLFFLKLLISETWSFGNNHFSSTKLQISNINSGLGHDNVIPGELKIKFNFRFGNDISDLDIKNRVESLLKKSNLKYNITWRLSGKPFLSNSKNLVRYVKQSLNDCCINILPKLSTSGGTSDGRFIIDIASELIELGPLNNTIHKVNECIKVKDLQLLTLIYENIMKRILI